VYLGSLLNYTELVCTRDTASYYTVAYYITSHHIEETDTGLDRPLYLKNKCYGKTLNHKITILISCGYRCHADLPCGYTIPLG